ncbi:hypothetical protein AB0G15_40070 [Streptosporangium sp. NPDC023825]|uniref:hypothetical protein n=1 Tax=Streptosporangium sp. NPDC023825 TaxID=3154909 RepID=UPI003417C445
MLSLALTLAAGTASACSTPYEPPTRPAALPKVPAFPQAERVWPDAFFETPGWIKDVRAVQPMVMLSSHEVLLANPGGRHPVLVSYDRWTGRHRVLARIPEGPAGHWIAKAASGNGHVAWMARVSGDGAPARMQIWAMPASGGPRELLAEFPGQGYSPTTLAGFEIADGHVIWWPHSLEAVRRVSLAGGPVESISGQGHHYMAAWPWAYDGRDSLLNLATGERREVAETGGLSRRCGPEWCVSELEPAMYELTKVVMQRVDGSGRTLVPGTHMAEALLHDRLGFFDPPFVRGGESLIVSTGRSVGTLGSAAVLYDRCTGLSALIDPPRKQTDAADLPDPIRLGGSAPGGPLLFWRASGNRHMVMDVSRVPADRCSP